MEKEKQNEFIERVMAMLPNDEMLKLNEKYECFTGRHEEYKRGNIAGFNRGANYVINNIKRELGNLP